MRFRLISRVTVLAGLVVSLSTALVAQPSDYVLGPNDVFTVTIWGPGGLSSRFTVEVDGTFTFPMLGRIGAGGLTPRQLEDSLINRLREGYFNDPRVTVVIEEFHSQHIFVVGEVKTPGIFNLSRPMTLVEGLALAGSTTGNAGTEALVRRRSDGSPSKTPVTDVGPGVTEIRVDLTDLQQGVLSNNPMLRDGDTIAVPRRAPVFVFGFVGRPGEYTIGHGATVRQVIALAGGVSQRGAAGRIKIIRGATDHEIKAELDDPVRPGDTIIVPERFF